MPCKPRHATVRELAGMAEGAEEATAEGGRGQRKEGAPAMGAARRACGRAEEAPNDLPKKGGFGRRFVGQVPGLHPGRVPLAEAAAAAGGGRGRVAAPGPWGGSRILPCASSRGGDTAKEACTERPPGWYKD